MLSDGSGLLDLDPEDLVVGATGGLVGGAGLEDVVLEGPG